MEEDYLVIDIVDEEKEIWCISLWLGVFNDVDYG